MTKTYADADHYDIRREGLSFVVYLIGGPYTRPIISFDARKDAVAYVRKCEAKVSP